MARKRIGALCMYAFILLGVAISLFPFCWLFVMSTRAPAEFFRFPPVMIPGLNLATTLPPCSRSSTSPAPCSTP